MKRYTIEQKFKSAAAFLVILILFPYIVSVFVNGVDPEETTNENFYIRVKASEEEEADGIAEVEWNEYLTGMLAKDVPADTETEALKAQAVAARTYAMTKLGAHTGSGYQLCDTTACQVYKGYSNEADATTAAVDATAGEVACYNGSPIEAVFSASTGGYTESSENVWNTAVPYLKSVDSKGDRQAPNNETTVTIAAKTLAERLGVADDAAVSVKKRTEAGYVAEVQAGSKTFSGREIRERLGLRSADFTIAKNGDSYIFTVHGYGHGAGMSQYGASFLAEQGKNYHEILRHYYTGISFSILE